MNPQMTASDKKNPKPNSSSWSGLTLSFRWSGLALFAILLFSGLYTVLSKCEGESWKDANNSDGVGYYAYLPATYIYHDFSYKFIDSLADNYHNLKYAQNGGFCHLFNGNRVNKYFAGESVLLTPFFLAANWASGSKKNPADGYSFYYMMAICLAAVFYCLLGLWSIRNLLHRFEIKDGIIAIILLCLFFGTNLYLYAIMEPDMSHIYSFGIISLFFLQLHKQIEKYNSLRFFFLSFLLALIMLIRPINVLVVLAIPFFAGNFSVLKTFFVEHFRHPVMLLLAVLTFMIFLFIQPLYYYLQCGKWYVYAYSGEGFDFTNPHFFGCLFSYSNGLYVYAPILFIATIGIFTFLPKNKFRFVSFLILFCIMLWVISSWSTWTYAGAFGMRPLVEYYSLFALLLGLLLERISAKRFFILGFSILFLLPLTALCQLQIWQYDNGIIGYVDMTREKYWMVFLETRDQFLYINTVVTPQSLPENLKLLYTKTIDFETNDGSYDSRSVITGKSFSGKHSVCLKDGNNHWPFIKIRVGDYFPDSILRSGKLWVNANSKWMLEDNGSEARLNVRVGNFIDFKLHEKQYVIHQVREENKWENCILNVKLPPLTADDTLRVYPERNIWFPVYVDDLTMNIYMEQ